MQPSFTFGFELRQCFLLIKAFKRSRIFIVYRITRRSHIITILKLLLCLETQQTYDCTLPWRTSSLYVFVLCFMCLWPSCYYYCIPTLMVSVNQNHKSIKASLKATINSASVQAEKHLITITTLNHLSFSMSHLIVLVVMTFGNSTLCGIDKMITESRLYMTQLVFCYL